MFKGKTSKRRPENYKQFAQEYDRIFNRGKDRTYPNGEVYEEVSDCTNASAHSDRLQRNDVQPRNHVGYI